MKIVLASQSPRRRELLARMGIETFEIYPATGEEQAPAGLSPARLVEYLSADKARQVAGHFAPEDIIIAADTVVSVDDRVLGKPHSRQQAVEMLALLSGRSHAVYTGVTVCRGAEIRTEHECTRVRFRPLTPAEMEAYVNTGEPMDKAGGYGIQGFGCLLVEGIEGDYYNVMGLPVCRLGQMLHRLGFDVWKRE
ncbi:MAG: septum formation inhibitor Maf [Oscillospiraceae bacterium]|nr:septum formation inhibitor Maf [Oscillospiraceae bacterium]